MTQEPQRERPRARSAIVDLAKTAIQALLLFIILSALIGRFEIHQISMEPNFHEGQRVLVSKLDSIWSSLFVRTAHAAASRRNSPFALQHGQVVVFFKTPARDGDALIKRVIGLPGETVEVREKKVFINGKGIDEPYVHFLQPPASGGEFREVTSFDVRERYGPVTVPAGQYFMMGDNRDNSADSRYWGFLRRDYIKGKALVIYWSYEAGREDYQDESAGATIKGLGSVFVHFFTRTRWDRMLHQIH